MAGAEREAWLMNIIECDHKVIEANTAVMSRLMATLEAVQGTLGTMTQTLHLLVGQVTVSINQRTEAVPLRVVYGICGILILIIAAIVGLDIAGYHIGE
jgi:hypothetical protein